MADKFSACGCSDCLFDTWPESVYPCDECEMEDVGDNWLEPSGFHGKGVYPDCETAAVEGEGDGR